MAGDFIPFLPAARSKSSHASSAFSPITASSAPNPAGPAAAPNHSLFGAPPTHQQVGIEIKKDGDRISQIRIQCRCGELIELDCEY